MMKISDNGPGTKYSLKHFVNQSFRKKINHHHHHHLCKTSRQKANALARIASFMDVDKKRRTMKDSVASQFGLCHLTWMLFSRDSIRR